MSITPFIRNILWASPLYLMAVIPFVLIASYAKINIDYYHVAIGALGWWIALVARVPVILLVKKKNLDLEPSRKITIGISGPTEEITRLVILILIGLNVPTAYSMGLGWAMIEVIYGLIQIIGLGLLDKRTDPKAEEAKVVMRQMGMDKTLDPSTPFWGALERVSASAIHIGFSLILVINPYWVIASIPIHSLINFFVVKTNEKSIRNSQLGLILIGFTILLIGLSQV